MQSESTRPKEVSPCTHTFTVNHDPYGSPSRYAFRLSAREHAIDDDHMYKGRFRGTAPPAGGVAGSVLESFGSPLAEVDGLDGGFRELPVAIFATHNLTHFRGN